MKPRPGLLHRARDELGADLGASWVIGDQVKDMELAAAAGCRGVLAGTRFTAKRSERSSASHRSPPSSRDLPEAVSFVLARSRGGRDSGAPRRCPVPPRVPSLTV